MKLRFLTTVAGDFGVFHEGQEITPTVMDDHLVQLLNSGACEVITEAPERAVDPRDRAVTPRPRGGGRPRASAKSAKSAAAVVPKIVASGLAIILGGGPSLTQADVDLCRGKGLVIAINDAYRLAPWADVLYAADAKWWAWHKGVPDFRGLKFSLQPDAAQWPGVTVLTNTGEQGLELNPGGLRTGRNSGYQAINLAVHLGATRLVLLGYDMQLTGGKAHWFGEHPDRQHSPYATFLERFTHIVEPLAAVGVEVVNSSRETALTLFPRVPLEDALGEEPT